MAHGAMHDEFLFRVYGMVSIRVMNLSLLSSTLSL